MERKAPIGSESSNRTTTTRIRGAARKPKKVVDSAREKVDAQIERVPSTALQMICLSLIGVCLQGGTAAAQAMNEASNAMCGTGFGQAATFGAGLIAMGLFIFGAFELVMAFKNLGNPVKQKEGRQKAKSGVLSMAGVLVFPGIAVFMDQIGLSTISCVDFANII